MSDSVRGQGSAVLRGSVPRTLEAKHFHTGKKVAEVPVGHGSQAGPIFKETLLKRFTRESPGGGRPDARAASVCC